jgi:hypothetical protein
MSMFWAFFVVLLLSLQGCAIERDPRGQWGYFENSRIPDASFNLKARPWGDRL